MSPPPRQPHNSRARASSQDKAEGQLNAQGPRRERPLGPRALCGTRPGPWASHAVPAGQRWPAARSRGLSMWGRRPASPLTVDTAMGQSVPSSPVTTVGPQFLPQGRGSQETQMRLVDGSAHPQDSSVASTGMGWDQLHPCSPGPEPQPHHAQ